jgi:hypothetical protein
MADLRRGHQPRWRGLARIVLAVLFWLALSYLLRVMLGG